MAMKRRCVEELSEARAVNGLTDEGQRCSNMSEGGHTQLSSVKVEERVGGPGFQCRLEGDEVEFSQMWERIATISSRRFSVADDCGRLAVSETSGCSVDVYHDRARSGGWA